MVNSEVCRTCGTERPAVSPGNLCPGCLMQLGLEVDLGDDGGGPGDERAYRNGAQGESPPGAEGSGETVIEIINLPDVEDGTSGRLGPLERIDMLGEIARGGVGVILLGRDQTLGRDLAVKVLQEKHRNRPEMVRRFVAEGGLRVSSSIRASFRCTSWVHCPTVGRISR